ncbi:MAG TPA: GNAT family N-acetyltransferase [Gemmatimonadales bacterium]|nr:GNAT family N-acetyltransferase [Gemmatimonadales bacterium]
MVKPDRDRAIRIREIHAKTDPSFRPAHRLLTRVFPRAEMLPLRAWVHVLEEHDAGVWSDINWHLFVAERDGRTVGAATGTYLGNVNVGLIGYIALQASIRSLGVGPHLRWALRLAFERDARRLRDRPLGAVVGEVAPDNPWLRRLVGHGAIPLDVPYVQPSLRPRAHPVPFVLYYQSIGAPRSSIPADEVRRLLYAIWRRAYRIDRPLRHPAFRKMLRSLAGRARVGPRRLAARPPSATRT